MDNRKESLSPARIQPMSELNNKIRKSRRALEKIDREYAADIERLRKENAQAQRIEETHALWANEHDLEEYGLDLLLTQQLRNRAKQLDVPLPEYPFYDKDDPDWDRNEHWYRSPMDGSFALTRRGRDYLDDSIWKKQERKYNRWARWVTLAIGLVGALTGLISVTASNWEKFATMLSRIWLYVSH